jgi:hypothetical protein
MATGPGSMTPSRTLRPRCLTVGRIKPVWTHASPSGSFAQMVRQSKSRRRHETKRAPQVEHEFEADDPTRSSKWQMALIGFRLIHRNGDRKRRCKGLPLFRVEPSRYGRRTRRPYPGKGAVVRVADRAIPAPPTAFVV